MMEALPLLHYDDEGCARFGGLFASDLFPFRCSSPDLALALVRNRSLESGRRVFEFV